MDRIEINDIRLDILKKYYRLEGEVACIDLYFNTFSELIDNTFGNNSVEKLNGTLIEKMEEAFHLVPRKYKLKLNVNIRDFGNYKKEEAERIIKENIDLKIYSIAMQNSKTKKISLAMFLAGLTLLIGSYFLSLTVLHAIIIDIVNISGTLLVWEAAALYFIERSGNNRRATQYHNKLKEICIIKLP